MSASIRRLSAIARLRAPIIAIVIHHRTAARGTSMRARTAAAKANGRAKIVCEKRTRPSSAGTSPSPAAGTAALDEVVTSAMLRGEAAVRRGRSARAVRAARGVGCADGDEPPGLERGPPGGIGRAAREHAPGLRARDRPARRRRGVRRAAHRRRRAADPPRRDGRPHDVRLRRAAGDDRRRGAGARRRRRRAHPRAGRRPRAGGGARPRERSTSRRPTSSTTPWPPSAPRGPRAE